MPGVTELEDCRAGCEMSEICYAFDYIVENGEISCTHIYKPRVPNPEYMQTISSEHMRENNITRVEAFQCTLGNHEFLVSTFTDVEHAPIIRSGYAIDLLSNFYLHVIIIHTSGLPKFRDQTFNVFSTTCTKMFMIFCY